MAFSSLPLEGKAPKAPKTNKWVNHRATIRYQCAPATSGRVTTTDQQYHRAWILDLSKKGAGLQLSRAPDLGTFLTIHIKSPATGQKFEIPAHVMHATVQANGDFVVGCEFVTPLGDDDLESLL